MSAKNKVFFNYNPAITIFLHPSRIYSPIKDYIISNSSVFAFEIVVYHITTNLLATVCNFLPVLRKRMNYPKHTTIRPPLAWSHM